MSQEPGFEIKVKRIVRVAEPWTHQEYRVDFVVEGAAHGYIGDKQPQWTSPFFKIGLEMLGP